MLLMPITCPCICTKTKLSLKQVLSLEILHHSPCSSCLSLGSASNALHACIVNNIIDAVLIQLYNTWIFEAMSSNAPHVGMLACHELQHLLSILEADCVLKSAAVMSTKPTVMPALDMIISAALLAGTCLILKTSCLQKACCYQACLKTSFAYNTSPFCIHSDALL